MASAAGISVASVPFLASAWHANPTQVPQRTHAGRPLNGRELISSGTAAVAIPSCRAPRASTPSASDGANGGIG